MLMDLINQLNGYVSFVTSWLNNISGGNQFLAGTMFMALGGLVVWLRRVPGNIYYAIKYRVTSSYSFSTYSNIGIGNSAASVRDLIRWYSESRWSILARRNKVLDIDTDEEGKVTFSKLPEGTYPIFYEGRLYFIHFVYIKEEKTSSAQVNLELTVSTIGFNPNSCLELIINLRQKYSTTLRMLRRYSYNADYSFNTFPENKDRESMKFYGNEEIDLIKSKITNFIEQKAFYKENNIPYRESFIFHGKPGTGKTTLISKLAEYFNLDISYVPVSSINYGLEKLLDNVTSRNLSLLVIEDIDSLDAITKRKEDENNSKSNNIVINTGGESMMDISLSDFLNAFDGIKTLENVIIIFTTNHVEKLDPAVTRRGRINNVIEITPLKPPAINKFIEDRFKVKEFLPLDDERTIPICDLQYMYVSNFDDYDAFKKEFDEHFK